MKGIPLTIRPARASDTSAVLELTKHVWDGRDYIGSVWDEWLVAHDQPLLVAEQSGETVGLARLGNLGHGEGWFQGLRVAEHLRGQGIGRRLLERCMELSRERGDRSLRYMTGADTIAMHRMAVAAGLRLELESSWLHAPLLNEPVSTVGLRLDDLRRLLDELQRSELITRYDGLYASVWRYQALNPARLARHLDRGEVLALPQGDAWAIVEPDGDPWLGYAVGTDTQQLLRAIRARPARPEQRLRALAPRTSTLRRQLISAGYVDEGHEEHCYGIAFT